MFKRNKNTAQKKKTKVVRIGNSNITIKDVTKKFIVIELTKDNDEFDKTTLLKLTHEQFNDVMNNVSAATYVADFRVERNFVLAKQRFMSDINGPMYSQSKKGKVILTALGGYCTISITDGYSTYHSESFEVNKYFAELKTIKNIFNEMAFEIM